MSTSGQKGWWERERQGSFLDDIIIMSQKEPGGEMELISQEVLFHYEIIVKPLANSTFRKSVAKLHKKRVQKSIKQLSLYNETVSQRSARKEMLKKYKTNLRQQTSSVSPYRPSCQWHSFAGGTPTRKIQIKVQREVLFFSSVS